MEETAAKIMALDLMREHGVLAQGWRLELDNGKRRMGATHYATRRITLSRYFIALNPESEVRMTVLHEIAHVLAGHEAGHGIVWQRTARRIGHSGQRTNSTATVPKGRYVATCSTCGSKHYRHRMSARTAQSACGVCCKTYNGGKYTPKFALTFVDTGAPTR